MVRAIGSDFSEMRKKLPDTVLGVEAVPQGPEGDSCGENIGAVSRDTVYKG
jgi:hypothetical protein